MSTTGAIVGVGQTRPVRRPRPGTTTPDLLAAAALAALRDAGLEPDDVDGLAVSSLTLRPDRAIDLAVRLGLRLRWIMDAGTAGASGVDMLQHALRAVEAGDADNVLLVAGDCFGPGDFQAVADNYNRATSDHLAPIPFGGPNAAFAMVTRRHMRRARARPRRVRAARRRPAAVGRR